MYIKIENLNQTPPFATRPAAAPVAGGGGGPGLGGLREEMLKELDRLKKFMSEQQ